MQTTAKQKARYVMTKKTIEISDKTLAMLANYCKVTGTKEKEAVKSAIQRLSSPFLSEWNEPKPAMYISAYSSQPCYVLRKEDRFGKPYFRIVLDGELRSVPQSAIRFPAPD